MLFRSNLDIEFDDLGADGSALQIMILFPYKFWGDDDMFGVVREENELRGLYYLFYSYADVSGESLRATRTTAFRSRGKKPRH